MPSLADILAISFQPFDRCSLSIRSPNELNCSSLGGLFYASLDDYKYIELKRSPSRISYEMNLSFCPIICELYCIRALSSRNVFPIRGPYRLRFRRY